MASTLKIIPKKRELDNCDDYVHVESRVGHRRVMQKYPPPKMRFGVRVIRDFPPACGITKDDSPLTNAVNDHMDSKLGKITSPEKNRPTAKKVRFCEPTCSRKKPFVGSRPAGKVKFWDPTCQDKADSEKSNDTTIVTSQKEQIRRQKIKEAMSMFDYVHRELNKTNKVKPKEEKIADFMVSVEAMKMVKQKLKWMNPEKKLGSICGVEIGDKFRYRSQLQMVGLHCQPQSGIDYTKIEGKNIAISIVDSDRYLNESKLGEQLFYSGQGGVPFFGNKNRPLVDQKLERGNLALKNSMDEKTAVRVIRKLKDVFVYDGLYNVKNISQKKGPKGNMMFIFQLTRIPGQPPLHKMLNVRS